jgi:hypothetical protein
VPVFFSQMFYLARLAADILKGLQLEQRTPDQNQLMRRLDKIVALLSDSPECEDAAVLIAYIAWEHVENANSIIQAGVVPKLCQIAKRALEAGVEYDGNVFVAIMCLANSTSLTFSDLALGFEMMKTLTDFIKHGNEKQKQLCIQSMPIFFQGGALVLDNLASNGLIELLLLQCTIHSCPEGVRECAEDLLLVFAASNSSEVKNVLKNLDSPLLHFHVALKRSLEPFEQILTKGIFEYKRLGITSAHISAVTHALLDLFFLKKACWSKLYSKSASSGYRLHHLKKSIYQYALGHRSIFKFQVKHELATKSRKSYSLRSEPPTKICQTLFLKIQQFVDADFSESGLPSAVDSKYDVLARKCYDAILVLAEISACCGIFWENYRIHRNFLDSSDNLTDEDPGGHTHLHNACFKAEYDRAKLVVQSERGLACKQTYGQGDTPAHYCTFLSLDGKVEVRLRILKLLVRENAECIFIKNKDGCTPYDRLLAEHGRFKENARKIAQWLHEQMTRQGWTRHSIFGWFQISQVNAYHEYDVNLLNSIFFKRI